MISLSLKRKRLYIFENSRIPKFLRLQTPYRLGDRQTQTRIEQRENDRHVLYLVWIYVLSIYDGGKPDVNIAEDLRFQSFTKCIDLEIFLQVNTNETDFAP